MSRPLRALLVALAAVAVAGCTQKASSTTAKLVGTHDLVRVDRWMFVTSTDHNELRVLDLFDPLVQGRTFVRAPNPLESLSVPVLDRPTEVLADSWYDASGDLQVGRYVYASRAGARELSIVDATRPAADQQSTATSSDLHFREIVRVALPGPLSAFATWHDQDTDVARVYVATWDGATSTILKLDLPADPGVLLTRDPSKPWLALTTVAQVPSEPVVALLAVPGLQPTADAAGRTVDGAPFCAGATECVVAATRAGAGQGGRTLMFDPASSRAVPLAFTGPVRALTTHGSDHAATPLRPGQHVFGILDEERCGDSTCGGLLAVDTVSGTGAAGFPLALDGSGLPMLPLAAGDGLINGVALLPQGQLLVPAGLSADAGAGETIYPVLGALTSSNGDVVFFDARHLQHLDVDPSGPVLSSAAFHLPVGQDAGALPWQEGPRLWADEAQTVSAVKVADGYWRSQDIVVVWEGIMAGLASVPSPASEGTHLTLPAGLADRVQLDDIVVFRTADGDCGETKVTAIGPTALDVAAVPAGCEQRLYYSVRAGPRAPLVVTATILGHLGRARPNGTLTYQGKPFAHLDGFQAGQPALELSFGSWGTSAGDQPQRGQYWTMSIDAHFLPFAVIVDYTSTDAVACSLASLPGSPAFDATRNLLFVAYPSANGVVELDPKRIGRGTIGASSGTYCYR